MQLTAVRTLTQALAAPALSSSIAGSTATLNWTAPTPTGQSVIGGYRVFKSATAGGTYTQFGANLPSTTLSLTDTLVGTQFYKVEAFDQFVTGGRSAGLQCVPIQTGGRFKFNPSVAYIYIDQNQSRSSQLSRMQALKAANPWIKGFQVFWDWSDFENPALVGGAAQYDGSWASQTDINAMAGFKLVDTFVNACVAMGAQFSWHIYSYGGSSAAGAQSTAFPSGFAPAYLAGAAYGPNTASSNGIFGGVWINSYASNSVGVAKYYRYWIPAVMARIIACWSAYGARYDPNPTVEVVSFLDESAMSTETSYSDAGAASTMIGPGNFFQALRAAWPTTALRWWGNYVGSSVARMDDMLAAAYASDWSVGGPDTTNESGPSFRSITADWRYRGLTAALGNGGVVDPTVPDYRTLGASNMRQVEPEDLNNPPSAAAGSRHLGDGDPVSIVNQANLMGATHIFWYDNRFAGPDTNQTATAHPNLLDFLNSARQGGNVNVNGITAGIALTNTAYPSSWPQPAPNQVTEVLLTKQGGPSNNLSNSQSMSWIAPASSLPISYYRVYDNNTKVSTDGSVTGTTFTHGAATNSNVIALNAPASPHYYQVSAVDNQGNEGPRSTQMTHYGYQGSTGGSKWGGGDFSFGMVSEDYNDTTGAPIGGGVCMKLVYPGGGNTGGWQAYSAPPAVPQYCLELGGFTSGGGGFVRFSIKPMSSGNTYFFGLISRFPFGDVFNYKGPNNIAANVIAPTPGVMTLGVWNEVAISLVDCSIGTTNYIATIGAPYGSNASGPWATMNVTSVQSGVGVDYGGYVASGAPAGTRIGIESVIGNTTSIAQWQVQGPGITGSTVIGSTAMISSRTDMYKIALGNHSGDAGGTVFVNDLRFTRQ